MSWQADNSWGGSSWGRAEHTNREWSGWQGSAWQGWRGSSEDWTSQSCSWRSWEPSQPSAGESSGWQKKKKWPKGNRFDRRTPAAKAKREARGQSRRRRQAASGAANRPGVPRPAEAEAEAEAPEPEPEDDNDSHSDSSSSSSGVDVCRMEVEAQKDAGTMPARTPADVKRMETEVFQAQAETQRSVEIKKEASFLGAGSPAAESPAAAEATASAAKGVVEDAAGGCLLEVAGSTAAGSPAVPVRSLVPDAGSTAGSTAAGSTAVQGDVVAEPEVLSPTTVVLSPTSPAVPEESDTESPRDK